VDPDQVREPGVAAAPFAPAPPAHVLAAFLDEYAPFGPAPLCPEVGVFRGRGLLALWQAAERLAGRALPAPFWAYPWPGGVALARLLLDRPEWVRGVREVTSLGRARQGLGLLPGELTAAGPRATKLGEKLRQNLGNATLRSGTRSASGVAGLDRSAVEALVSYGSLRLSGFCRRAAFL